MRKSRFTEAQIIGMIKEQEAGMPTAEVCRKHGVSQGTFYKYKSKYGGMEVSDVANACNSDRAFRGLMTHLGATEMIGQYELKMDL